VLQQVLDLAKSQPQAPVTEAAPAAAAAPQRRAAPRADLGGRQPPATQRNGRPPKRRRAAKPWEWDRDATPPSRPAADRPAADGRGARRPPDGQRGPAARPGVQHEYRRSAAFKSALLLHPHLALLPSVCSAAGGLDSTTKGPFTSALPPPQMAQKTCRCLDARSELGSSANVLLTFFKAPHGALLVSYSTEMSRCLFLCLPMLSPNSSRITAVRNRTDSCVAQTAIKGSWQSGSGVKLPCLCLPRAPIVGSKS